MQLQKGVKAAQSSQSSIHPASSSCPSCTEEKDAQRKVINLKAKVTHGYTSQCVEEGLGFQLSRFCS